MNKKMFFGQRFGAGLSAIVLLVTLQLSFTDSFGQVRIGHVNSNQLIQAIPEFNGAMSAMENFQKDKQSQWEKLFKHVQQLEKLGEELSRIRSEANKDSIDSKFRELEIDYRQSRDDLQELQTQAEQEVVKKQEDLFSPLMERVNKAITLVAEERGYGYILDLDSQSPSVVFFAGGDNLNDEVKAKMKN